MAYLKEFRGQRLLYKTVNKLDLGPDVLDYNEARELFVDTFLLLAKKKVQMKVSILSGEQSIIPSQYTFEAMKDHLGFVDELITGGGPGTAIDRKRLGAKKQLGQATYGLKPSMSSGFTEITKLPYYDMGAGKSDDKDHPYIELCREFKKNRSGHNCSYSLEPYLFADPNPIITIKKKHIAMIEVRDENKKGDEVTYIPLAIAEDLHLPFEPKQAGVYRHLDPDDQPYKDFTTYKNFCISGNITHDLEKVVRYRLVDPNI